MNYLRNLFISIDQLGNTIAGGNPDSTISARVGYFSNHAHIATKWYWISLEKIINTTFWPMDGEGHCHQAFHNDAGEEFEQAGSDFIRFILSFIIIASCALMILPFYILWLLGIIKHKDTRLARIKTRFRSSQRKLTGLKTELEEEPLIDSELPKLSDKITEVATAIGKLV